MYIHPAVRVDWVEAEGFGDIESATRLVRVAWAVKVEVAEEVIVGVLAQARRGRMARQQTRMRRE